MKIETNISKKVGLTGGIACGKSTVAKFFKTHKWQVIDTDEVAHQLIEPGAEGYKKVIDAFGVSILNRDESINRDTLGTIIFSNKEKRKLLNSILHPLIRSSWQSQYSEHVKCGEADAPPLIVIPLLFEGEIENWFDEIICIGCTRETQMERLKKEG